MDCAETEIMSGKSTPDNNRSKIFLTQLGLLKKEEVLAYFNQYGNVITKYKFVISKNNTLSYGFIIFSDIETAEKVLEDRPHNINKQNVICRPTCNQPYLPCEDSKKWQVFVIGLSSQVSVKSMRQYFIQFGEIYDVALKERSIDERRNGLAYVTFTQRDSVEKTLAVQKHSIDGCYVYCKRVLSVQEWQARVPKDNREHWSKGKKYRDQPRCALVDDQPENIIKSTEKPVMALRPKPPGINPSRGNGAIYSASATPVPPEWKKMAGVQIEETPSVGRGRGLHLHLMKLRVNCETIQPPTAPKVEAAPDWDHITTNVSREILKSNRSSKTSDQPAAILSLGSHCTSNRTIVFNSGNENSSARTANPVFPSPPPSSGRGKFVAMTGQNCTIENGSFLPTLT